MLFEILTGKAVASQERAALRIGPRLQVPVTAFSENTSPKARLRRRSKEAVANAEISKKIPIPRDFLTIGLEHLTRVQAHAGPEFYASTTSKRSSKSVSIKA